MATLTTLVATGQTPVMAQTVGGNTTKVAMLATGGFLFFTKKQEQN